MKVAKMVELWNSRAHIKGAVAASRGFYQEDCSTEVKQSSARIQVTARNVRVCRGRDFPQVEKGFRRSVAALTIIRQKYGEPSKLMKNSFNK